jgi:hypothetical protein
MSNKRTLLEIVLLFTSVEQKLMKRTNRLFSFDTIEREEESWGGSERDYRFGGGCNRNIIWQFGRFPGSAR